MLRFRSILLFLCLLVGFGRLSAAEGKTYTTKIREFKEVQSIEFGFHRDKIALVKCKNKTWEIWDLEKNVQIQFDFPASFSKTKNRRRWIDMNPHGTILVLQYRHLNVSRDYFDLRYLDGTKVLKKVIKGVNGFSFNIKNENLLLITYVNGDVGIWNLKEKKEIKRYALNAESASFLSFSDKFFKIREKVASGSKNENTGYVVCDVDTGAKVLKFQEKHNDRHLFDFLGLDDRFYWLATHDCLGGRYHSVWDFKNRANKVLGPLFYKEEGLDLMRYWSGVELHPDLNIVAFVDENGTLHLRDLNCSKEIDLEQPIQNLEKVRLAFNLKGDTLAVFRGYLGQLILLDVKTGKQIFSLSEVYRFEFDLKNDVLVVQDLALKISLWDLKDKTKFFESDYTVSGNWRLLKNSTSFFFTTGERFDFDIVGNNLLLFELLLFDGEGKKNGVLFEIEGCKGVKMLGVFDDYDPYGYLRFGFIKGYELSPKGNFLVVAKDRNVTIWG